jgi:hypothetical protein
MLALKRRIAAGFVLLLAAPAGAQTADGQGIEIGPRLPQRQDGSARIQVSVNVFVPGTDRRR